VAIGAMISGVDTRITFVPFDHGVAIDLGVPRIEQKGAFENVAASLAQGASCCYAVIRFYVSHAACDRNTIEHVR
jgi:hypothetical protein